MRSPPILVGPLPGPGPAPSALPAVLVVVPRWATAFADPWEPPPPQAVALVYMFSGIWARAAYSWSRRRRRGQAAAAAPEDPAAEPGAPSAPVGISYGKSSGVTDGNIISALR